jgi:deoxyadenosine/deoxycytidine kinase
MQYSTPTTIVIVGCYATGKTTLALRLSQLSGFQYFVEVGGEIRARSKCRSPESCSIFDELVMFRELERDKTLLKTLQDKTSLVLEQWHIGNIAYVKVRNPQVAQEYLSRLQAASTLREFSPVVISLDMEPEAISKRISYASHEEFEQDLLFFAKWRCELEQTFSDLSISPIRIDATGSPSDVYNAAHMALRE